MGPENIFLAWNVKHKHFISKITALLQLSFVCWLIWWPSMIQWQHWWTGEWWWMSSSLIFAKPLTWFLTISFSLYRRGMGLKDGLFSGLRIGWLVTAQGLWSMVLCQGGGWSQAMSLRGRSWDWCPSASLSMTRQWHQVHPPQVCRWHQDEQCRWYIGGKKSHPEGPEQAGEVGPWKLNEV